MKKVIYLSLFLSFLLFSCGNNSLSPEKNETAQDTTTHSLKTLCKFNMSGEKPVCHICGKSNEVIPYVYGLATKEKMEKEKRGELKIGGCEETVCQPKWFCKRDSVDVMVKQE